MLGFFIRILLELLIAFLIFGVFWFPKKKTKRDLLNTNNINNEVDLRQIVERTIYSIQDANKNSPRQRVKVLFSMVLSAKHSLEEKDNHSIKVSKILHADIGSELHTEMINKTENYIQFSVEIAVGRDLYDNNTEPVNFGLREEDWF